jgi:hypothetical protein
MLTTRPPKPLIHLLVSCRVYNGKLQEEAAIHGVIFLTILPLHYLILHYYSWFDSPSRSRPTHCSGFEITLRHTTLGRTPLDERSTRLRNLYLTDMDTHGVIRTLNPSKQAAADASLRPRGYRDRLIIVLNVKVKVTL